MLNYIMKLDHIKLLLTKEIKIKLMIYMHSSLLNSNYFNIKYCKYLNHLLILIAFSIIEIWTNYYIILILYAY